MESDQRPIVTVILGAGASRDVSYASGETGAAADLGPKTPSPLDRDFFDLLQQFGARTGDEVVKNAMRRILDRVYKFQGDSLWQSMEKMFYMLHVSAVLEHKLFAPQGSHDFSKELVDDFLLSIRALLDEAHGTRTCDRHMLLLQHLYQGDAIITFNYDFVAERALAARLSNTGKEFGDWFYGYTDRPQNAPNDVPTLFKLHGSLNWEIREDQHGEVQNAKVFWPGTWGEFARELAYFPKRSEGYAHDQWERSPILLPYWDKRIEKGLWLKIWRGAAKQLRQTDSLIVWGYSLPTTDLKARELLRLAFEPEAKLTKVAVIDPSQDTQDRWRSMFVRQQFWRFHDFDEFHNWLTEHGPNLAIFR